MAGPYGDTLLVSGNVFTDNWSGILAWENADRFAGSPANTSTGVGTLVDPSAATVALVRPSRNIMQQPYVGDCRWKTQNVVVEDNHFAIDRRRSRTVRRRTVAAARGLFELRHVPPNGRPTRVRR